LRYLRPGGIIIIAHLMFLNNMERMKQKEILLQQSGRKDLWDIIEDEYYTNIEEIKNYSEQLGYEVMYEHIVNL
jgi:putative AdoMet-dependent methyltransferase